MERGIIVLTKCDMVDAEWRAMMREDFLTNVWPPVADQMRRIGLDARTLLDLTEA